MYPKLKIYISEVILATNIYVTLRDNALDDLTLIKLIDARCVDEGIFLISYSNRHEINIPPIKKVSRLF
jgi:hypothetical protein